MNETARGAQSELTAKLSEAQENHANQAMVYRLYTEFRQNLPELVSRYFTGATFLRTTGLWEGITEDAAVIEIVATRRDLQSIVFLAGDIKQVNGQTMVLVTYQNIHAVEVTDAV